MHACIRETPRCMKDHRVDHSPAMMTSWDVSGMNSLMISSQRVKFRMPKERR